MPASRLDCSRDGGDVWTGEELIRNRAEDWLFAPQERHQLTIDGALP